VKVVVTKMPNIKDVARMAGVSISTVSNIINGTKPVSDELKERVEQVITELDYQVDPVARSLKSKKTMTVGIVIPTIYRIFFPQLINGIQDSAKKYNYNLTFCSTDDLLKKEKYFIKMLESNWVDGIILSSVAEAENEKYFEFLSKVGNKKKKIPIVSLERRIDRDGIDSIVVDNYKGGCMATRHLIECKCRKIAHITGPMYSPMVNARLMAYKDELKREGFEIDENKILHGDYSPLSGYQAVKRLLMTGTEVDGVFAANDQMAIGAIKAFKEQGYNIPEQVKVVGFDNTFVASIVDPSLTTIDVPKYRMGFQAMEIVMKRINNQFDKTECIELPINLIVRQSTDLRGEKNWDLYGW
jgi:DNA-binding LacI/PurR family transcriptional regulator